MKKYYSHNHHFPLKLALKHIADNYCLVDTTELMTKVIESN